VRSCLSIAKFANRNKQDWEVLMNLGFFTMPIHPIDKDWRQCLHEDREAFILADELGFTEAYCGEHTTDKAENISSCVVFLASLVGRIKNMRLGTGTVNMPNSHPARIAAEVAMLDHLLDGKFNFGISPGGLPSDSEVFGTIDQNKNEMFVECIEQVLEIWRSEPPYNIKGKYWNISTERTMLADIGQGVMPKPLQLPHPPIIGTVVAPFSKGVTLAAKRGWDPISANFLLPQWVASHWPMYADGCVQGNRPALRANWRVAKSVFIADDEATAKEYATGPNSPYRFYFNQLVTKMKKAGRSELFKRDRAEPDDAVTTDRALEDCVIYGTPSQVVDKLEAFREQVGDFGTMLYAGHDWADVALARRSMVLLAEQVNPRLSALREEPQVAQAAE
jgi:alkanesulfonate monooxygenase SsuD/methylene tetrahydromethanopterin reductase-like flavin-dependent oxidoreductase (luciferase family)